MFLENAETPKKHTIWGHLPKSNRFLFCFLHITGDLTAAKKAAPNPIRLPKIVFGANLSLVISYGRGPGTDLGAIGRRKTSQVAFLLILLIFEGFRSDFYVFGDDF